MQERLDWSGLEALLAFSRTGSLSAAAKSLAIDETTLARQLKRLSTSVGANVVRRSGTRLVLSQEGEEVAKAAVLMESAVLPVMRFGLSQVPGAQVRVRVTGLASFLSGIVVPAVPKFAAAHPGILLDLVADTRNLSIADKEADIAIRFARPKGPHLVGRRIATFDYAIFAAAKPKRKAALGQARWLQFSESMLHLPEAQWLEKNVPEDSIAMRTNSLEVLINAVAHGIGQMLLPVHVARKNPELKQLGGVALSREIWLVYHQDDRATPRIRAVADWLIGVFKTYSG
jgi:DNA-binding transcriptional LysR family regulator